MQRLVGRFLILATLSDLSIPYGNLYLLRGGNLCCQHNENMFIGFTLGDGFHPMSLHVNVLYIRNICIYYGMHLT